MLTQREGMVLQVSKLTERGKMDLADSPRTFTFADCVSSITRGGVEDRNPKCLLCLVLLHFSHISVADFF